MKEPKDQRRGFGVRLEPKPSLIRPHVVECLIDNRKPNDRINDVGIDADFKEHARQERDDVSECE